MRSRRYSFKQELLRRGYNDDIVAAVISRSQSDIGSTANEIKDANDKNEIEERDSDTYSVASSLTLDVSDQPAELNHLHVAVWLEAVDPHHRYSKSLMKYFRYWQKIQFNASDTGTSTATITTSTTSNSNDSNEKKDKSSERISGKPERADFFSWLDFGGGCHLDLPWCPRRVLERRRVKYMNLEERSWFEVIFNEDGLLIWKLTGELLHTPWGLFRKLTKGHLPKSGTWIFVLSREQQLYVGQKIKGRLHHSSFTAGAPTIAAGNIRANHGKLIGLKPQSGHYRPDPVKWKQAMDTFLLTGGIDTRKNKTY
jgi:hypothetical protein